MDPAVSCRLDTAVLNLSVLDATAWYLTALDATVSSSTGWDPTVLELAVMDAVFLVSPVSGPTGFYTVLVDLCDYCLLGYQ